MVHIQFNFDILNNDDKEEIKMCYEIVKKKKKKSDSPHVRSMIYTSTKIANK